MTKSELDLLVMAAKAAKYNIRHVLDYGIIIDSEDVVINEVWNPFRNIVQLYCLARSVGLIIDFEAKQVRKGRVTYSWGGGLSESKAIITMCAHIGENNGCN